MGWKLIRLLPGLLLHRVILSNIVALFRVFTHVVVSPWLRRCWVLLENLILPPRHLQFIRKDLICSLLQNNIESYCASASEEVITAAEKKKVAVMISVIGKETLQLSS